MLPVYTPKHPGHVFPACQHATHDLMATILRQNSTCDVHTMRTMLGCDVRSLEQCGGSVWPHIRQKTAEAPHFSSILRFSIDVLISDCQYNAPYSHSICGEPFALLVGVSGQFSSLAVDL